MGFLFYIAMAKYTFYFSHDYNARNDEKIKKLLVKHGYFGYGIFWAIIEDLYNNANALRTDYDCIAYHLRSDYETIKSIINDFDLFIIKDEYFSSLSVERRLNERNEKSLKARESAFNRWNKFKNNANAMRTQCDGNAIKERKGKEIKEINIDLIKQNFKKEIEPFVQKYGSSMCNDFYRYWTELNKSKTKCKFQLQNTWETEKRLITWDKRSKNN